ncbi:MAG: DUF3179 domain-containing protein [Planctomycetota bacterium]
MLLAVLLVLGWTYTPWVSPDPITGLDPFGPNFQLSTVGSPGSADTGDATEPAQRHAGPHAAHPPINAFFDLFTADDRDFDRAAETIRARFRPGHTALLLEVRRFSPAASHRQRMDALIDELTGQDFRGDTDAAWHWVWAQPYDPHPGYAAFKAQLYRVLDPRFEAYFDDYTDHAHIRLDEIRWGGVRRDGIPPLDHPRHVAAGDRDARYLADTDVVFGVAFEGQARAYPKRILAWHEMVKDTFGTGDRPLSVNGVYCTLCGSMIVYRTEHRGTHHELGTSGFLYRSNKLMYDHATESMWSTLTGEPVVGPLVGQGIRLEPLHVVTTSWGQWKKRHPATTVLTLDTGHRRDYGEGVAYRSYFATDRLMFTVPRPDAQAPSPLLNKAEVLALRFAGPDDSPTAIDTELLARAPVYLGTLGSTRYAVLTDPSGANRVYDIAGHTLETYDGDRTVIDTDGHAWTLTEDALRSADGQTLLPRLPAHRAFWFGWRAAYPDTVLLHIDQLSDG